MTFFPYFIPLEPVNLSCGKDIGIFDLIPYLVICSVSAPWKFRIVTITINSFRKWTEDVFPYPKESRGIIGFLWQTLL